MNKPISSLILVFCLIILIFICLVLYIILGDTTNCNPKNYPQLSNFSGGSYFAFNGLCCRYNCYDGTKCVEMIKNG
jgi:hypothetical protein